MSALPLNGKICIKLVKKLHFCGNISEKHETDHACSDRTILNIQSGNNIKRANVDARNVVGGKVKQ